MGMPRLSMTTGTLAVVCAPLVFAVKSKFAVPCEFVFTSNVTTALSEAGIVTVLEFVPIVSAPVTFKVTTVS